jgi:phosphate transport system permease protein
MRRRNFLLRKNVDLLVTLVTGGCALVSVSALLFILGYIFFKGFSSVSWQFLTQLPKPVGETGGGIANAIVGSVKVVALACVLGIPVGLLGAVYLSEYGSRKTAFIVRYCADILNGMPSIVIGVFAYTVIVLPMKGFSALAASVALGIIMIPLVLRNCEEFLRLVPVNVREGALALGVPRWKVVLRVVLPAASRGLVTSMVLAMSRVAGETAPLIFTAFGSRYWDNGMLHPIATLPLMIFTYAVSPYEDWHNQAWAAALVLLLLVLCANAIARALARQK